MTLLVSCGCRSESTGGVQMAAQTGSILPSDVVEVDVKGRHFFAVATGRPERQKGVGLVIPVEPITYNISYRNVRGRDVVAIYRKLGRQRNGGT